MRDGIAEIVTVLKAKAKAAWNLTDADVLIGEERTEKKGAGTKYAAIVWENVDAEQYAHFTEYVMRPCYLIYVGPAPAGKKGADAKSAIADPILDKLSFGNDIVGDHVNTSYSEDWGEATNLVTIVLEFSFTWHEARTQALAMSAAGTSGFSGSAE